MKLAHVTIMVKDLEESLKFYKDILALPIVERFKAGPEQEIVFLGNGNSLIELIYNRNLVKPNIGQDISIGFGVEDLDDSIENIKDNNIEIHSGPFQPNKSTRFFFVLDPNGLKVQFIEQK